MKFFNTTPNGGVKLYNDDFVFLQEANEEAFLNLIEVYKKASNVEVIILSGLNVTFNGGSGIFSDGFIFLDGEIMEFQESSYPLAIPNSVVWDYEVETIDQRSLANNAIEAIYTKKVAKLVPSGNEVNIAIPWSSHSRIETSINDILKNQDFVNYVGSNLTYTNPAFIAYLENNLVNFNQNAIDHIEDNLSIKSKVIEIGQWNIDAQINTKSITLTGVNIGNQILSVNAMIYPDDDLIANPTYDVLDASENGCELKVVFVSPGAWRVDIDVDAGSIFKTSSDYDSTSTVLGTNRGYILVSYI
jgi:hypothetical protein